MTKKFIGENKVLGEFDVGEGMVKLVFEGHPEITMSRKLYDIIVLDKKYNGNVTDRISTTLATKFLKEMADYGMEINMVPNVVSFMGNLAHNLREELLKRTFGRGGNDLPLSLIIKMPENEKEAT
jgi:hypothetical protein